MKTRIGNKLYITHFYYSEMKTRGVVSISDDQAKINMGEATVTQLKAELKRRRDNKLKVLQPLPRTTTCVIKKATSETESVEIAQATARNITTDHFSRGEGRKESFAKTLDILLASGEISTEEKEMFEESFYTQCPSSKKTTKHVDAEAPIEG